MGVERRTASKDGYSRAILAACAVQLVSTTTYSVAIGFLTLFIYHELKMGTLPEAALWAGIALLVSNSAFALVSPFWGWLTTRIGAKKMLFRVMLVNALVPILISMSTNVYQVVAFEVLQGVFAGTSTILMTLMASSVREERLPQTIGVQQSIMTVGSLAGPGMGVVLATLFGFRSCFFISGLLVLVPIPIVLWAHLEDRKISSARGEKVTLSSITGMSRELVALFSVEAAFTFISPILPLYLSEAGLGGNALLDYTGLILFMSGLVYAISVPITTRIFGPKAVPILLGGASAAVFLQGLFRQPLSFIALRMIQCFLHSAAPSILFSSAARKGSNKGVIMGTLNSARMLGDATGPFVASGVAYATNLTTAFAVTASISLLAAITTFSRGKRESNEENKGAAP